MKKTLISLLFVSATTSAFISPAYAAPTAEAKALIKAEMQQAQHVTPAALDKEMQAGKNIVVIDVRQKSERPIMGALTSEDIHIPRGFLEIKAYSKVADRNSEIVVICGKGIRSAFAANTLNEMGYKNVRNLKGGVKAWKEAGLTTIKP
mgnify:FL=1